MASFTWNISDKVCLKKIFVTIHGLSMYLLLELVEILDPENCLVAKTYCCQRVLMRAEIRNKSWVYVNKHIDTQRQSYVSHGMIYYRSMVHRHLFINIHNSKPKFELKCFWTTHITLHPLDFKLRSTPWTSDSDPIIM